MSRAPGKQDGTGLDGDEDEPELPDQDGPVFLLGACALVDAMWAAVGEDPLTDVLTVLLPVLEKALPSLGGQVAADALTGAFATEYRCEQPGDAEVLERIKFHGGNTLENLVTAGGRAARDVLRVGLTLLSTLTQLCRRDSASLVHQAA